MFCLEKLSAGKLVLLCHFFHSFHIAILRSQLHLCIVVDVCLIQPVFL